MKENSYFSHRINQAHEQFMGADGWDNADGWNNTDAQSQLQADAVQMGQDPKSKPYIINVVNTTTAAVQNVEILNAAVTQFGYTPAGLTYSYGYSNISMQQFRANIASGQGFEAGLVKLFYSNVTAATATANVPEVVTISTLSPNGSQAVETFVPMLDDYQYQQQQVTLRYQFLVTGLVSMLINQLLGSTTVKIMIFPRNVVSQFDIIKGNNPSKSLSNPNVNPALTAANK